MTRYYNKIPNQITRHWTKSAVDCYEIGCRCSKCSIPLIMETPCRMKAIVIELVRKFGKPERAVVLQGGADRLDSFTPAPHIKTKGIIKNET